MIIELTCVLAILILRISEWIVIKG